MNHHVPAPLPAPDSPSTVNKAPRILRAAEMILPALAAGRAIGAAALRLAMDEALRRLGRRRRLAMEGRL